MKTIIKKIEKEIADWENRMESGACGPQARGFIDGLIRAKNIIELETKK